MPLTYRTAGLVALAVAAALGIVVFHVVAGGNTAEAWQLNARYTARFAILIFLVAFTAPSLLPAFGDAATRDTFLAFAAAHAIHLAALLTFRLYSGEPPTLDAIIFGGLAYGLLFGLAIRHLRGTPPPWIQPYIFHYILLIVALTYASRLPVAETRMLGIVGVAACLVALTLRHGIGRMIRNT